MQLHPSDDRAQIEAAAFDPAQSAARREACAAIAAAFAEAGKKSLAAGHAWGMDGIQGLGAMTCFAAELSAAAIRCLRDCNCYAAAALVRQLVEIQYFMWLFAEDGEASQQWLNASAEDMRRTFRPAELRTRSKGVFDNEEYRKHCDMAGHPNPAAGILLNQGAGRSFVLELAYADLAQHLERIWRFFNQALGLQGVSSPLDVETGRRVNDAILHWHKVDRLSSSLRTEAGA
jgi:hypothetical protein